MNHDDSVPALILSLLQTGLVHQLGHNKEEQDPAQPGPVLSQATEALWSLLKNAKLSCQCVWVCPHPKLSSSDCKTNSTSRNTNRRLFCMLRFAPVSSLQMTSAAVAMLTGRETTGGHLPSHPGWGQETLRTHQSCHYCKQRNITADTYHFMVMSHES